MADSHSTSQDIEIWKPVAGYEHYLVSNFGRLARLIKPRPSGWGYPYIGLTRNRTTKQFALHTIVAAMFIGPRPKGCDVNHIDGNKLNARASNLEYATRSENMRHAHRMGLVNRAMGERIARAKFTEAQIRLIRRWMNLGASNKVLATCFRVTPPTIRDIRRGATWKHVIDIEAVEITESPLGRSISVESFDELLHEGS